MELFRKFMVFSLCIAVIVFSVFVQMQKPLPFLLFPVIFIGAIGFILYYFLQTNWKSDCFIGIIFDSWFFAIVIALSIKLLSSVISTDIICTIEMIMMYIVFLTPMIIGGCVVMIPIAYFCMIGIGETFCYISCVVADFVRGAYIFLIQSNRAAREKRRICNHDSWGFVGWPSWAGSPHHIDGVKVRCKNCAFIGRLFFNSTTDDYYVG